MKSYSWMLIPAIAILFGLTGGIGLYTFVYAKGYAYLSNDAAVCANCHVMNDHFTGWIKSTHHAVAVCNDCHIPKNPVRKYLVKASNGFWHSFAFTTGVFHDPIQIKAGNHEVTEAACRSCHGDIVMAVDGPFDDPKKPASRLSCVRCHDGVGHLR